MTSPNRKWKAAVAALLLAGTTGLSWKAAASPTVSAARPAAVAARVANRPRPPGITDREAMRLRYQHQQYQQMKRLANADGQVTRAEQARLNHKAQQLRRLIHVAKSN